MAIIDQKGVQITGAWQGRTIRRVRSFVSFKLVSKFCSVLGSGLDELTLWNLFGLDLDIVVRLLDVASSLGELGRNSYTGRTQEVDMWTGAVLRLQVVQVLYGTIGSTLLGSRRDAKTMKSPSKVCPELTMTFTCAAVLF